MRLVLLGPPGAGKGTQGHRLAVEYRVPHIASGDIVRDHIARKTPLGLRIEAAIAQGNLAPDADMIASVFERLSEPDAQRGFVLDGFPRNVAQARALDAELARRAQALDAVLYLAVPEAELIERVAGRLVCPVCDRVYHIVHRPPRHAGRCDRDGAPLVRRPDDEPEAVRHRLRVYEAQTVPLRDYYESQGLLRAVDAAGGPEEVFAQIVRALPQGRDQLLGYRDQV